MTTNTNEKPRIRVPAVMKAAVPGVADERIEMANRLARSSLGSLAGSMSFLAEGASELADITNAAIMKAAKSEVAGAVDIQPRYNENFQDGLNQIPRGEGMYGRPLDMSGQGPQQATAAYSELASQAQELVRQHASMAELLVQQGAEIKSQGTVIDGLKKAVGLLLAEKAGLAKAPDWQSKQAKKEDTNNDDDDAPDEAEIEKAVRAVQSGKASVKDVMLYLEHGRRDPLRSPPSGEAFLKAAIGGPSDAEIDSLDPESAVEALMERQRAYKRAAIAAGKLVLPNRAW